MPPQSISVVTDLAQDSPQEVERKIQAIGPGSDLDCLPRPFIDVLVKGLPEEERSGNPLDLFKAIDLFVLLNRWTWRRKMFEGIPADEEHTITIYAKEVDKRIGHDYARYLAFLLKHGVIAWFNGKAGYKAGEKSKDLTVLRPFFATSIAVVKCEVSKRTKNRRKRVERKELRTTGDHHRLKVLENAVGIRREKALLYLAGAEAKAIDQAEKDRIEARRELLMQLSIGKVSYWSDKYERRHTQYTRMTKEDRGFIEIDGEAIGSVDIRSSQLQLLWVLLSQLAEGGVKAEAEGRSYVLQIFGKWSKALNPKDISTMKEELPKFRKDLDRDIYQVAPAWLLEDKEYTQRQFDAMGLGDREKGKALVIKALFGTHNLKRKKLQRCWERRYPAMSKALKCGKAGSTRKENNLICHALQSFESWVVLEEIGNDLEARGIRCIYIHDSVLCPVSRLEEAAQVFRNKLSAHGLHNVIHVDLIKAPTEYIPKAPRPRKPNWKKHRDSKRVKARKPVSSGIHSK